MKEDLIGEEVVLTGPRAQISRLLTNATRVFLAAAEITEYDEDELAAELAGAVDDPAAPKSESVAATLRVTADGLEVIVAPESDPAAARTVVCVR